MNKKVALLYIKIRLCQREHLGSFSFSNPNLQARWWKERLDRKKNTPESAWVVNWPLQFSLSLCLGVESFMFRSYI